MDERMRRREAIQAELRKRQEGQSAATARNAGRNSKRGLIAFVALFVALVLLVVLFEWILLTL